MLDVRPKVPLSEIYGFILVALFILSTFFFKTFVCVWVSPTTFLTFISAFRYDNDAIKFLFLINCFVVIWWRVARLFTYDTYLKGTWITNFPTKLYDKYDFKRLILSKYILFPKKYLVKIRPVKQWNSS